MLDGYISEKEQLESLRKWWNEHGKLIAIAIVIGLCGGFLWKYWRNVEVRYAENAAMLYQSVLNADAKNDTVTAQGGAKILMERYTHSPYASMAALLSAKESIVKNDLSAALTDLQWVIHHSKQKRLQQMARLDAARILLSQQKPALAMQQLKTVDDKSFQPLIDWVTGDINAAEGNKIAADTAYRKAKNAFADFPPAQQLMTRELAN